MAKKIKPSLSKKVAGLKQKKQPSHKKKRAQAKATIKQARPTHKKVLLHPFTVFLLLCCAVYIARWTFMVHADSYTISAKVAAPALSEGAVITSPADGGVYSTSNNINVEGTCPNNSYVILERNGLNSGMAWCAADNTFSIAATLLAGVNILQAQAYNITDDPGPLTSPITLTYNPPIPPTTTPATTETKAPSGGTGQVTAVPSQPIIIGSFIYQSFEVNKTASWHLDIQGGSAPYSLSVSWGEGNNSKYNYKEAQTVSISHKYQKAGYFPVKIHLTDGAGSNYTFQLFAIIKLPASVVGNVVNNDTQQIGGVSITNSFKSLLANNALAVAWGSFTIVSLMTISFWLGERQQINNLIRRKNSTHRHA